MKAFFKPFKVILEVSERIWTHFIPIILFHYFWKEKNKSMFSVSENKSIGLK